MSDFKFNIGERVICTPGYTYHDRNCPKYSGAGYGDGLNKSHLTIKERIIITVQGQDDNYNIYFFNEIESGIYEFALVSLSDIRNDKISKLLDESSLCK